MGRPQGTGAPVRAPSATRALLSRLIAADGTGGTIMLRGDLGESADGPDLSTGSMAYPACRCEVHRAGKGQPDSAVRLGAKGAP